MCYIGYLKQRAFNLVARDGLEWLECGALARFPWLLHAFSTRAGKPASSNTAPRACLPQSLLRCAHFPP